MKTNKKQKIVHCFDEFLRISEKDGKVSYYEAKDFLDKFNEFLISKNRRPISLTNFQSNVRIKLLKDVQFNWTATKVKHPKVVRYLGIDGNMKQMITTDTEYLFLNNDKNYAKLSN